MMFNKKPFVYISLLLLTACMSTTKNIKPDQNLETNQGIVVTKIHSNWDSYKNPLLATLEYAFTHSENKQKGYRLVLSKADDLKVVVLPAGDYNWFRINFGRYYMNLSGSFSVKANEINYIGDIYSQLDVPMFSLSGVSGESKITDETEQIKIELKEHFPDLLEQHKFNTALATLQQE
jgi:hypothetical protein